MSPSASSAAPPLPLAPPRLSAASSLLRAPPLPLLMLGEEGAAAGGEPVESSGRRPVLGHAPLEVAPGHVAVVGARRALPAHPARRVGLRVIVHSW